MGNLALCHLVQLRPSHHCGGDRGPAAAPQWWDKSDAKNCGDPVIGDRLRGAKRCQRVLLAQPTFI